MLTLQKTDDTSIVSVATSGKNIDDLLDTEWLLANTRGGYASSTIACCNTRRYHSLLTGSLNPPTNRIMALASCMEMVIANGQVCNLSTFEFNEKITPKGFKYIKQFRRGTGAHFDYQLDIPDKTSQKATWALELTKSIYLLRDDDTVCVVYDFTRVKEPVELVLRPFVGLRDFHDLQKSHASLRAGWLNDNLVVRHDIPGSCELFLHSPSMKFEPDEQWWFNFVYRTDKQRGQDFTEDLWAPGFFKNRIEAPGKVVLWANLRSNKTSGPPRFSSDIEQLRAELHRNQSIVIASARTRDQILGKLSLAADQFITRRHTNGDSDQSQRTTILAGFPWFADWGRDAFISLPGLLFSTGRFDEARSILTTFAAAADEGMIPNRFDDRTNTAYFNSIDASLWFINAAFQYLKATDDAETFTQQLLPTIRCIVESYQKGTRFGICADSDGLITAGSSDTQLTWMDAKFDGVAFTPRHGKTVEINALWYNSLCYLCEFYSSRDKETAQHYKFMADKVAASFSELFWNENKHYLNDCIFPDGSADDALRPNQIFAVSLPFSPLSPEQQKSVVNAVHASLLTPYGLRTLSPDDKHYKGQYSGPQRQRDEAYHQGTVWPYLIGPFVESFLKVNDFDKKSKKQAAEFIEPLLRHLVEDGCLGQISEIFDGDPPHKPRGCFAQAWSVAELVRAYQLIQN